MRAHGLQFPFHPLQVLSWVVLSIDVIVFAVFGIPVLASLAGRVVVAVLFAISVACLVAAGAKATVCDPVDPRVQCSPGKISGDLAELVRCPYCNCQVSQSSHHCKACDKCVEDFDHHCMWLNNCIGRQNYRAFMGSILSVVAMTGLILGCCLAVLIECAADDSRLRERSKEIYGGVSKDLVVAALSCLLIVNLPLWVLDAQLVILHGFLNFQHVTTFEYILRKKEQLSMSRQGADGAGGAVPATLPRCLDWIVFSYRRARSARTIAPAEDGHEAGA